MSKYTGLGISVLLVISSFFFSMTLFSAGGATIDLEPGTWVKVQTTQVPGIRICQSMTYDSESDVIIMFGGFDCEKFLGETWVYDFNVNTWTNKKPLISPPGRVGTGFVYDPGRDICILFGGVCENNMVLGDTWKYDYNTNTWTELKPTVSPSPRGKGFMAYDIESDQMIWFGGYGSDLKLLDETWSYNYDENQWVNRTTTLAPQGRKRNPMVYDEESDRVILFGGWLGENDVLDDTWSYDFNTNTWANMNPKVKPNPTCRNGLTYDLKRDLVVLSHGFGGEDGDRCETWTYDYNTNTWSKIEFQCTVAEARHCFYMHYDDESDTVVFQGGADSDTSYSDTWIFKLPEEAKSDGSNWTIFLLIGVIVLVIILIAVMKKRTKKEGPSLLTLEPPEKE